VSASDRAREWVNENCSELDGEAWERKYATVLADLQAIDAAADRAHVPYVEVDRETAYGRTVRLSRSVRVF